ncbi:zinc finger protein ZAT5-like [Arachis stenosperma]|uniref:zinc finger protein ZAT5-like n=1 Tax=Arachis stenosperma TaxID=217475 RepID=UPI0025ABB1DD|nr:zinc finger protein ZAT5-like [Arachis stenosperma]
MDYKEDYFSNTNSDNCNVVHHDATHHIAKGKRTKRLRLLCGGTTLMTAASSCSSASGDHGSGDDHGSFSISSTTNQEEEDMANCLILLAQGGGDSHQKPPQIDDQDEDDNKKIIEIKSRKFSEIETATINNNKVGFYIYECKTCNRTFPSFQALGGHRASHKKPKLTTIPAAEDKKPPPPSPPPPLPPPPPQQLMMNTNYDHSQQIETVPPNNNNPIISLQFGSGQKGHFQNNKPNKIHECSICGSEFTSGQALGGHMRRHRATAATAANNTAQANVGLSRIEATSTVITTTVEVQPRNILELDLNLPAPEEDLREPKFQFATAATKKSMVLSSAPALVDCHY